MYENGKYLKSIADYSKIVFDEIKYLKDIASMNVTHTILTNASKNFHDENVKI